MVGALSMSGSAMIESSQCISPCLSLRSEGAKFVTMSNNNTCQKTITSWRMKNKANLTWHDWRLEARALSAGTNCRRRPQCNRNRRGVVIVSELGGQYDDSFEDVKAQTINYFTYKAVRTVMNQLYEMNPTHYRWFYDFVLKNRPGGDGKRFIRILAKERQDLAERVMVTRLHLYGKWIKKCDHAEMYKEISDQNLELMRERLMETVIWPSSDDTNTAINDH